MTIFKCPYCTKTVSEEVARYKGCCGEVHCEEFESEEAAEKHYDDQEKEWKLKMIQQEICAYVRDPSKFFLTKEK